MSDTPRDRFPLQLTDREHADLKALAALLGVTMQTAVRCALTDFLGRAGIRGDER